MSLQSLSFYLIFLFLFVQGNIIAQNCAKSELIQAVNDEDISFLKHCLKSGFEINTPVDSANNTLLHLAIEAQKGKMVEFLLEEGANINAVRKNGSSPIFLAVSKGNMVLIQLLTTHKANINYIRPQDGSTVLHIAAQVGNSQIIQFLLNRSIHINRKGIGTHITPLLMAAFYNHPDAVALFLKAGADIHALSADGLSVLHATILGYDQLSYEIYDQDTTRAQKHIDIGSLKERHEKTMELLLQGGVDKSIKDQAGKLALDYAIGAPSTNKVIQSLQDNNLEKLNAPNTPDVKTPMGHTNNVYAVAFTPDNKKIVSGGSDKLIKLWHLSTRSEAQSFQAHDAGITDLDISVDGNLLLTSSYDIYNNIRLWNLQTGTLIKTFAGHGNAVTGIQYLNNDQQFISCSWDKTLKLWDITSGKILHSFEAHKDEVNTFTISKDERLLVSGSKDGQVIVWDLQSKKLLHVFEAHKNGIYALDISANQQRIASATEWGELLIWDIETKIIEHRINFGVWTNKTQFFHDDQLLLAGVGGTFQTVDVSTGQVTKFLPGHLLQINDFSFSSNGQYIVSGSNDKSIKIWGINNFMPEVVQPNPVPKQEHINRTHILKAKFIDNHRIAIGTYHSTKGEYNNSVRIFDWYKGEWIQDFEGAMGNVSTLHISPDQKYLAAGINNIMIDLTNTNINVGLQNVVNIWEIESKKLIQSFSGHDGTIYDLAFTPNNHYVISSSGKKPYIENIENVLENLETFMQKPDIQMWSIESGQPLRNFEGHTMDVPSLCIIPNTSLLLTGSYDKTVRTWDYMKGNLIQTDNAYSHPVAASQDGQFLIKGATLIDGQLSFWDAKTNKSVILKGHSMAALDATFSTSDKYAVTGSMDNQVILWDVATQKFLHIFSGHTDQVLSVDISPDEQYIISTSLDNSMRMWDIETKQEILELQLSGDRDWLFSTPEGYYTASKGFVETVSFSQDGETFTFDQFDLKWNRPDLVFNQITAFPESLKKVYHKAYQKRLEKMNFTEDMLNNEFHTPTLKITSDLPFITTTNRELVFSINVYDTKSKLDRINVSINDVSIFGRMGLNLRPLNTQEYNGNIRLLLSNGQNKIQISTLNQNGAESLKETFYVTYNGISSKPDLHIIGIGVTEFDNKAMNLSFAAKDVKNVLGTFSQAQSQYHQVKNYTLLNHEVNLKNLRAIKQELQQTNIDDHVILYIAGHGIVDDDLDYYLATYDTDFTNPSSKAIPYEEIENLLDGIPARKKLMLIDACFSGEIDKESLKLIKQKNTFDGKITIRSPENIPAYKQLGEENAFELMKELFVDLRRGTGAHVISSASGVEFAIEGEKWKNGVFTYAFLKGLREMKADLNGDGQIFVSELQSYLATEVPRLTDNHQRPTMRVENISNDWRVW